MEFVFQVQSALGFPFFFFFLCSEELLLCPVFAINYNCTSIKSHVNTINYAPYCYQVVYIENNTSDSITKDSNRNKTSSHATEGHGVGI